MAAERERSDRAWARRVGIVVGLVILVLAPLIVRVAIDGRAELARADAAAEAGELDAEIRHLGRAARLRLPLATHDERALARLHELARAAADEDGADERTTALAAWRELRRALIATRIVDVRDPELLAEANAAIVELMIREARATGRTGARERWTAELDQDLEPRGRSLLAALCFVAWLGACVGWFVRGLDDKGRLVPRPALRWGGAVLLLLLAWILFM